MSKKDEKLETGNKKQDTDDDVNQQSEINNQKFDGDNREEQVKIKEVIKEINTDYKDKWLRAQADYQNLVKETETRRAEWVRYSEQQILEEFIPVYDNFKKAFLGESGKGKVESDNWAKGIGFIMKQFGDILKNHGVEEIKTIGEKFNPERHEAMGEEESGTGVKPREGNAPLRGKEESGTILREIEAGYEMRGRVIKVAKVIVVK